MSGTDSSSEHDRAEQRGRHWARRLALQALYQWDVSGGEAAGLLEQFSWKDEFLRADARYFEELVRGVVAHGDELDRRLTPALDRPVQRLDPVARTVLRFGCYELLRRPDVPTPVILSEATRLARKFGTDQGSKYVNAVLDRVALDLRKAA